MTINFKIVGYNLASIFCPISGSATRRWRLMDCGAQISSFAYYRLVFSSAPCPFCRAPVNESAAEEIRKSLGKNDLRACEQVVSRVVEETKANLFGTYSKKKALGDLACAIVPESPALHEELKTIPESDWPALVTFNAEQKADQFITNLADNLGGQVLEDIFNQLIAAPHNMTDAQASLVVYDIQSRFGNLAEEFRGTFGARLISALELRYKNLF